MKVDDRTYFEEEQRMDSRWMFFFVLFSFLLLAGIAVAFLVDKETDWTKITIVLASILFSDILILFLLKTMKLDLAITKNGLHYRFFAMVASQGVVNWNEVAAISLRKAP